MTERHDDMFRTSPRAERLRDEGEPFDLTSVLDLLLGNRLLIASFVASFTLFGMLYALCTTPVYETNMVVQVDDTPDGGIAKSVLGEFSTMFNVKSNADGEMQILGSRLVVSGAVDALKLYITAQPVRLPVVGNWIARHSTDLSQPGFAGLQGYTWGREQIEVENFDMPAALYDRPFTLTYRGDGRFSLDMKGLGHAIDGFVGVPLQAHTADGELALLVRSIDARDGAAFVLLRSSRLKAIETVQNNLKITVLGKDSNVIYASLQGDDPDRIEATLNEIGRQYLQQNVARKAAQAEKSLDFLAHQEPQLRSDLEASEDRYNNYRNKNAIVDLDSEAKIALRQSADLEASLLTLMQKREELMTRFNAMHPAVIAIDQQIAAAQRRIDLLTGRIKRMPMTGQGALRLEREVRVNADLYLALRNNIEQLRLLQAGKIATVRVVDSAYAPELPVKPKRLVAVAVAALLGAIAGVGMALLREQLFRGIRDPYALEHRCGVTVMATIPYGAAQQNLARRLKQGTCNDSLLVDAYPRDPVAESLRSLRTALQFAAQDTSNNVNVITGATPGVGKSFVAANLAQLFAVSSKRVLLIDADLRRGHLHQYVGVARSQGLAEVLAGAKPLSSVIRKNVRRNLDFISTGSLTSNSAELLVNGDCPAILAEVCGNYDIVLIDTPPVLAVSDAEILAPLAGNVLVVARSGVTRAGEVDELLKRLIQGGASVTGVVLNGMKMRTSRYVYGWKYGNYRTISYGYEEQR